MGADNEPLAALVASDNAPQLMLWRVYRSPAQLHRHRAGCPSLFAIGFKAHGREHSTGNRTRAERILLVRAEPEVSFQEAVTAVGIAEGAVSNLPSAYIEKKFGYWSLWTARLIC